MLSSVKSDVWLVQERDFEASFGSSSTTEVAFDKWSLAPGSVCRDAKNVM